MYQKVLQLGKPSAVVGGLRQQVAVFGHLTVDRIFHGETCRCESIGGPPAYGGLTALKLGHAPQLVTRYGPDILGHGFTQAKMGGLSFAGGSEAKRPTTRFEIHYSRGRRRLRLLVRCSNLRVEQVEDASYKVSIVSPICGEISGHLLERIRAKSEYLFVDPQGFVRGFDPKGWAFHRSPPDRDFVRVADAVKVGPEEAAALTRASSPLEVVKSLLKMGSPCVVHTWGRRYVYLATRRGVWRVASPAVEATDPTGAGDIFSAAFATTMVSDGDPLWALSKGLASVAEILGRGGRWGLDKVVHWRPSLDKAEAILGSIRRIV
jgi:sugar/nucleoside kinase (ribokinase family)